MGELKYIKNKHLSAQIRHVICSAFWNRFCFGFRPM
jgi:hypothetical protein